MEKPKNPCTQDCPDRSSFCHADCERGKAFYEDRAKWREQERRKNNLAQEANRYHKDTVVRYKKWREKNEGRR